MNMTRTATLICAVAIVLFTLPAYAGSRDLQDAAAQVQDAAEQLAERSDQARQPLTPGETRVLKAVVMKVEGRAQWRADSNSNWNAAKVDDMLEPGALIRTGRRSKMVLRVGQNATILVDRNTRVALPEIVQDGDRLRTAVQVERGRADFKVDKVGLTNDFSVVTPSSTLAVRGTGYAVSYGGLDGTKISGSRFNELFAIEVRYFLSRFAYLMSGAASSSDGTKNPVLNELFESFGPPQILTALVESEQTPELLAQQLMQSPVLGQRAIDIAMQQFEEIQDELGGMIDPDDIDDDMIDIDFGDFGDLGIPELAAFICLNLDSLFSEFSLQLLDSGLGTQNLGELESEIVAICQAPGDFDEFDYFEIIDAIVAYCDSQHQMDEDLIQCYTDFSESLTQVFIEEYDGGSSPQ